jgi:hypothetical protein
MNDVVAFPCCPRPAQADLLDRRPEPADVVRFFVPTLRRQRAYLRRQGLRIAAGVGGASFAEAARFIRLDHAKFSITGEAAEVDLAEALDFIRAIRDAADRIGREPAPGSDWGRSA